MNTAARALVFAAVLLPAGLAHARAFRVQDIPNGGTFQCVSCHTDASASSFTNFGSNARSNLDTSAPVQQARVNWPALCPLDSDNDGRSNGEELGDPECKWSPGATPSTSSVSNPGVQNGSAMQCDNGKLDSYEECDNADLMTWTKCVDVNAGAGQLTCRDDCTFDYSDCSNPPEGWDQIGPAPELEDEGCSVHASGGPRTSSFGLALLGVVIASVGVRRGRRARA